MSPCGSLALPVHVMPWWCWHPQLMQCSFLRRLPFTPGHPSLPGGHL